MTALLKYWRALRALRRAYRKARRPLPHHDQRSARRKLRRRRRALDLLGGACACCGLAGEAFASVLTLHHVRGTGGEHRRLLGSIGRGLSEEIVMLGGSPPPPFDVEILCRNCHELTHALGRCPHRAGPRLKAVG